MSIYEKPIKIESEAFLLDHYKNKYIVIVDNHIYAESPSFQDIHQLAKFSTPKDRFYIIRFIEPH
jgi:hypothetical protein